jgi:hypothetical protein
MEGIFISAANISQLPTGQSECVIAENGYAEWFAIGVDLQGKSLSVNLPKDASFSVYDSEGSCVFSSVTGMLEDVVLPADGLVVFAGLPGAVVEWSAQ